MGQPHQKRHPPSESRLDRIEAILDKTAKQQEANTAAIAANAAEIAELTKLAHRMYAEDGKRQVGISGLIGYAEKSEEQQTEMAEGISDLIEHAEKS